jgi:hypothetical protein
MHEIKDADLNMHSIYGFGFERNGKHSDKRYFYEYDERIKATIISIIQTFFISQNHHALVYFCYDNDGFDRHRSIIFGKWYRDNLAHDLLHHKRKTNYNDKDFHGGMLVRKDNPLKNLLIEAADRHLNEMNDIKAL